MLWDLLNSVAGSRYWVAAGWTMLHFLWVGLAITGLTLLLRRLLDRAAPEIRYAAVFACFVALALVPIPLYRWTLSRASSEADGDRHTTAVDETNQPWSTRPNRTNSSTLDPSPIHTPLLFRLQSTLDRVARWFPFLWA